jgi:multiple sugar transport system permease protein
MFTALRTRGDDGVSGPSRDAEGDRRQPLRRFAKFMTPYSFVAPALVLFGLLGVYVIGYGVALSFVQWNGFSPNWTWVGLGNYRNILYRDPLVSPVVIKSFVTTLWVLIALPVVSILISLPIAFVLSQAKRLRGFFRTVFFLPYVTNGIAVYFVWELMYQPSGIINTVLRHLHLRGLVVSQGFLGTASTALPAVMAVMVWTSVPLGIVLYLAGLQTIDPDLLDAVRVDGGGRIRTITSVLWPLLRPITVIVAILEMQQALQGYALFLIMTGGGPINSTNVLGLEVYNLGFGSGSNIGYANALAWVVFLIAAILALIMLRFSRRPV